MHAHVLVARCLRAIVYVIVMLDQADGRRTPAPQADAPRDARVAAASAGVAVHRGDRHQPRRPARLAARWLDWAGGLLTLAIQPPSLSETSTPAPRTASHALQPQDCTTVLSITAPTGLPCLVSSADGPARLGWASSRQVTYDSALGTAGALVYASICTATLAAQVRLMYGNATVPALNAPAASTTGTNAFAVQIDLPEAA
jgi:hypothetical protein